LVIAPFFHSATFRFSRITHMGFFCNIMINGKAELTSRYRLQFAKYFLMVIVERRFRRIKTIARSARADCRIRLIFNFEIIGYEETKVW